MSKSVKFRLSGCQTSTPRRIQKGTNMKKTIHQILMVIGFAILVAGTAIVNLMTEGAALNATFTTCNLAAIFAVTCIFANNTVIKHIGYCLAAFVATMGAGVLAWIDPNNMDIGMILSAIGMLVMGVAVILYVLIFILKLFGFVKNGTPCECGATTATLDELSRYKEMLQDKILTEEEFNDLKQKTLENAQCKEISIDDLKKWKKLLDQQIITEAEFKKIKEDLFNK